MLTKKNKILTFEIGSIVSLAIVMFLTRGSHITTLYALPDASLALFLIGGIYLRQVRFFIALFFWFIYRFWCSCFGSKTRILFN